MLTQTQYWKIRVMPVSLLPSSANHINRKGNIRSGVGEGHSKVVLNVPLGLRFHWSIMIVCMLTLSPWQRACSPAIADMQSSVLEASQPLAAAPWRWQKTSSRAKPACVCQSESLTLQPHTHERGEAKSPITASHLNIFFEIHFRCMTFSIESSSYTSPLLFFNITTFRTVFQDVFHLFALRTTKNSKGKKF